MNFNMIDDSINAIKVSNINRNMTSFNIALENPIANHYSINTTSDIDRELMDSFIDQGYYCSNMNRYIFLIADCTDGLIESFYVKLMNFIMKYNINPIHFTCVFCDNCNIDNDMKVKISNISNIQYYEDIHS